MKILHISFSHDFTDGGITTVIKQIIKAQKEANLSVEWVASNNYRGYLKNKELLQKICEINPSLIHLHGLWRIHTRITQNFVKNSIPYVITPHGMLDNWALRQSIIKKKLSWSFWEKHAFDNCSFIQALCDSELNTIRKINSSWKVYKISNGIVLPDKENIISKENPIIWKEKIPKNAKVLLFIGRFHKKKGINQLIKAWEIIIKDKISQNWWICFVGSGELNILNKKNFNYYSKRIIVSKPVFDLEKEKVFKNSSAFILPSFSEGLPMAPLEAMSYQIPCLISKNCNLPEALKIGAAIETNPSIEEIVSSLKKLFKMNILERRKMTDLAYNYLSENHNWNKLTNEIKVLYGSICKQI
tara:strand:- start:528 stop:1601 length:1074 start_codon:yes stop_codon:yes gene_type:complete